MVTSRPGGPYNSRIALRYMEALEAAGDRAGALRHATEHSDLLRTELDAAPEREVVALAARPRLTRVVPLEVLWRRPYDLGVAVSPDGTNAEHMSAASTPGRPSRRAWALPTLVGVAVLGAVGVVGGALTRDRGPGLNPKRVAVPVFANHTGRPDLDDVGVMAADWIIRGLMETPLVDVTDVQAVYVQGQDDPQPRTDPLAFARRHGAGMVIRGSYYRSGDSVLFQASIIDVATGRVLRSLDPVGTSLAAPTAALEVLRERVAAGLSPLVSALNRGYPVDPDLVAPPSFPAYREFVAGLGKGDSVTGTPRRSTTAKRRDWTRPSLPRWSSSRSAQPGTTNARSRIRSVACSMPAGPSHRLEPDHHRSAARALSWRHG